MTGKVNVQILCKFSKGLAKNGGFAASVDRFDRQSSMPHFLYKRTMTASLFDFSQILDFNPTVIDRHGNPTTIEQRASWAHKK